MILLAFTAAIAGMLCYGVASVLQGFAASRASGADVLKHPAYLGGLGADALAWLASLVALAALPIFVVQSILAGSLAVTILLAWRVLRIRITRRDVIGIAVVVAGLVLVSLSAGTESHESPSRALQWWLLGGALAVAAAAAALYRRGRMIPQGIVAGLGFGGTALCARAAEATVRSVPDALASPAAWGALVSGVIGAVLYARSLEHGRIGPPTAALWVVEVVVPSALGVWLLGDAVRSGWALPALAGAGLAVIGCVVLATSEANASVSG